MRLQFVIVIVGRHRNTTRDVYGKSQRASGAVLMNFKRRQERCTLSTLEAAGNLGRLFVYYDFTTDLSIYDL